MSTVFASLFLGMNLVQQDVRSEYQEWYAKEFTTLTEWGWPCRLGQNFVPKNSQQPSLCRVWNEDALVSGLINFGVCGVMTLMLMAFSEYLIREENARRAAQPNLRLKQ